MLLKSYHHLYPLFKVQSSIAYKIDEDKNLNNFEIVADTNKLTRKFVNKELLIFHNIKWIEKKYQMPFGVVEEI
jgi:hypothetical protein